jgi:hypothetical protein
MAFEQAPENMAGIWLLPGYGYTFTRKNWYLSGALLGGYGMYQSEENSQGGFYGSYAAFYRLGLGFNDGKWLIGILYQEQSTQWQTQVYLMDMNNRLLKIHAGLRWEAGQRMKNLRKSLPILRSF